MQSLEDHTKKNILYKLCLRRKIILITKVTVGCKIHKSQLVDGHAQSK